MRSRAFRRHQTNTHMWRRLKKDFNQHYNDLKCDCHTDPKIQARFKEQPKQWTCYCCSSPRYDAWLSSWGKMTMQERRFYCSGPKDYE